MVPIAASEPGVFPILSFVVKLQRFELGLRRWDAAENGSEARKTLDSSRVGMYCLGCRRDHRAHGR